MPKWRKQYENRTTLQGISQKSSQHGETEYVLKILALRFFRVRVIFYVFNTFSWFSIFCASFSRWWRRWFNSIFATHHYDSAVLLFSTVEIRPHIEQFPVRKTKICWFVIE